MKAKNRLALHRRSVCATGGGKGTPELTPTDETLVGIIRESLLSAVVTEAEWDTDVPEAPNVSKALDDAGKCMSCLKLQ